MDEWAMIALGIIFKDQLPVCAHIVFDAFCRTQLRQVPMAEFACQRSENCFQWIGILSQIQKDETFPNADVHLVQRIGRFIESFALLHVGSAEKVTIQGVCPGVIGALNGLAKMAFVFLTETGPAVTADVVERAKFSKLIAHNEQTFSGDFHAEIIACAGNIVLVADTDPVFGKNACLFLGENLV